MWKVELDKLFKIHATNPIDEVTLLTPTMVCNKCDRMTFSLKHGISIVTFVTLQKLMRFTTKAKSSEERSQKNILMWNYL